MSLVVIPAVLSSSVILLCLNFMMMTDGTAQFLTHKCMTYHSYSLTAQQQYYSHTEGHTKYLSIQALYLQLIYDLDYICCSCAVGTIEVYGGNHIFAIPANLILAMKKACSQGTQHLILL